MIGARRHLIGLGLAVAAFVAASPADAQPQNRDLQCPHGQWLRPNFYTTWPAGTTFLAEDQMLASQHLNPNVFGLGCHGEEARHLGWDNPDGTYTTASNQFSRRFCSQPGVLNNSQAGFLFACRGANPGPDGDMSNTSIAWFASRTGVPVTGATEYLIVDTTGRLQVVGWNNAGTARDQPCGDIDSFITAIPYRNRNTGLYNPMDCEFVVTPADRLRIFGNLTSGNPSQGTCTHSRCGPAPSGGGPRFCVPPGLLMNGPRVGACAPDMINNGIQGFDCGSRLGGGTMSLFTNDPYLIEGAGYAGGAWGAGLMAETAFTMGTGTYLPAAYSPLYYTGTGASYLGRGGMWIARGAGPYALPAAGAGYLLYTANDYRNAVNDLTSMDNIDATPEEFEAMIPYNVTSSAYWRNVCAFYGLCDPLPPPRTVIRGRPRGARCGGNVAPPNVDPPYEEGAEGEDDLGGCSVGRGRDAGAGAGAGLLLALGVVAARVRRRVVAARVRRRGEVR